MRVYFLTAVLALSACSSPHASNSIADVRGAAEEAQGDIDTYAANTMARAPAKLAAKPTPAPVAASTPASVPMAADTTDDGTNDAVDVARRYFALIEAREYDRAWALREQGQANRLTRRQFADSFAKYAEFHAQVGTPGRIDAGAGQRYIEIPVRAYGTLTAGKRPFVVRGSVTLHRTADIDGATAEQRSWRLRDAAFSPGPAETIAAAPDKSAPKPYRCAGATRVSARDDSKAGGVWRRGDDAGSKGPPIVCTEN